MDAYYIYALIGAIGGTLSGILGIGGGVIVVPALLFTFEMVGFPATVVMHLATGTSLAAMVGTAAVSTYTHHRLALVHWGLFNKLLAGVCFGTILGGYVASILSTKELSLIFGTFLFLIAIKLAFFPNKESNAHIAPPLILVIVGSLIVGGSAGLLGVGGGVLMIPLLLYFGLSIRQAAGLSVACTVPISIIGTLMFMLTGWGKVAHAATTGYIYWPAALCTMIASALFVPLGSYLASILPIKVVHWLFILLLCVTAVELIK